MGSNTRIIVEVLATETQWRAVYARTLAEAREKAAHIPGVVSVVNAYYPDDNSTTEPQDASR